MDKRTTRRSLSFVGLIAMTLLSGCTGEDRQPIDVSWIDYPEATRGDAVDAYHDVEVSDPYRWLEDEASDETQAWLAEQDRIAERFFEQPSRTPGGDGVP